MSLTFQIVQSLLDVAKNNRKPVYEMASEVPLILYSAEHTGVNWIEPLGAYVSFYGV